MDINAVEDWEQHVTPLLQEMPGHGDDFFNTQELLVSGQPTTSPLSAGTGAPSLSPGGSNSVSGVQTGAISPGSASQTSAPAASCCENGRPIMTDPVSGQVVCSCQYDQARLALSGYPRLGGSGVGVYGAPYPSTEQNPYPSIDSSAFYSPLSNPYALKESGATGDMTPWTSAGLQPTTGYYPYDPTLAAYGYGAGYDLAARRKNATRESTATLKAWLNEHKKNPYPTKGEKIMLAIITKMTLTQVSTWFANARRRLKKENKMTWEPKNKTDDDDDAMVSDDDKDKDDMDDNKLKEHKDSIHLVKSEQDKDLEDDDDLTDDERKTDELMGHHPHNLHHSMLNGYGSLKEEISKNSISSECGVPIPATKPKIWSLADTAACKTPPPPNSNGALWGMPQGHQYGGNHMGMGANGMNMNVNSFALPSTAISPNAPYSRYNAFLGHYNPQNTEIQTDTPPQTPPNMKLPSNVSYNGGNANSGGYAPGSGHHHNNGGFLGSFRGLHSPHKGAPAGGNTNHQEFQSQAMMVNNNNNQQNIEGGAAAFKPFYKSSQQGNGFVSPV